MIVDTTFWGCHLMIAITSFSGQVIQEKDKCPQCRGNKVIQEKKILEVNIEKGMTHGQKITFQGEADEAVCTTIPYHYQ